MKNHPDDSGEILERFAVVGKTVSHNRILEKLGENEMGKNTRFDKVMVKARIETQKLKEDMSQR